MVIVIQPSSYKFFGFSPLAKMILEFAQQHPQINFIILGSKGLHTSEKIPSNLRIEAKQPEGKTKLTTYYWRKFKLPSILQKNNANYFISDEFPTIGFDTAKSIYLSPQTFEPPLFLVPAIQKQKDVVNGFSFYLDESSAAYAVTVLKAFSIFKKRLRSELQLYFIHDSNTSAISVNELVTYKYRTEVHYQECSKFLCLQEITASSLAFLYLPASRPHSLLLRTVMQKGAVIITNRQADIKPAMQNLVIPVLVTPEDIAEKMMTLYKNETLVANYKNATVQYISEEPPISLQGILNGEYDYIKPV